jgi:hypothetical protein
MYLKYTILKTNHMHTLLYTKMFELHSHMFRTDRQLIFRESHNFSIIYTIQKYEYKTWIQLLKIHQPS